jgi:hypothetical protein
MNMEIAIATRLSMWSSAIVTRISMASTMIKVHWIGEISA